MVMLMHASLIDDDVLIAAPRRACRNYYRCSAEGCGVKKRVERDSDDPRYVVTTYDGVHNHAAPGDAYLCPPRGTAHYSPPVAAPSWSAALDAWEAQLHRHAAAAAHSSESSY
jgi:hypothetical protein